MFVIIDNNVSGFRHTEVPYNYLVPAPYFTVTLAGLKNYRSLYRGLRQIGVSTVFSTVM